MPTESQYGGTTNSIEILLFHLTTVKILKAAHMESDPSAQMRNRFLIASGKIESNTTPHTVAMAQQDAEQFAKYVRERVFMRAFQALGSMKSALVSLDITDKE